MKARITEAIKENSTLKRIILKNAIINYEAAKKISDGIKMNSALQFRKLIFRKIVLDLRD
jgi:hypothetical protein